MKERTTLSQLKPGQYEDPALTLTPSFPEKGSLVPEKQEQPTAGEKKSDDQYG